MGAKNIYIMLSIPCHSTYTVLASQSKIARTFVVCGYPRLHNHYMCRESYLKIFIRANERTLFSSLSRSP